MWMFTCSKCLTFTIRQCQVRKTETAPGMTTERDLHRESGHKSIGRPSEQEGGRWNSPGARALLRLPLCDPACHAATSGMPSHLLAATSPGAATLLLRPLSLLDAWPQLRRLQLSGVTGSHVLLSQLLWEPNMPLKEPITAHLGLGCWKLH